MQDYRSAKPHHPDECAVCALQAAGHMLCQADGCSELAELQYPRHATAAEYATLPESLQPIDGIAHRAVFVCGDHEPDPICGPREHPDMPAPVAEEAPCPACPAAAGQACVKSNGTPRSMPHRVRVPAFVAPSTCVHVHREDCGGYGLCACRADDPAPDRPKRAVTV